MPCGRPKVFHPNLFIAVALTLWPHLLFYILPHCGLPPHGYNSIECSTRWCGKLFLLFYISAWIVPCPCWCFRRRQSELISWAWRSHPWYFKPLIGFFPMLYVVTCCPPPRWRSGWLVALIYLSGFFLTFWGWRKHPGCPPYCARLHLCTPPSPGGINSGVCANMPAPQ